MDRVVLVSVVLVLLGACAVVSARDIYNDVRFYYDPESKLFVTQTITRCYLVALTHLERDHIHSRGAMEDLEVKLMRDWLGVLPETRIYHDDQSLSQNIHNWCVRSAHDIFQLNRVLPTEATSPLVG